MKNRASFRWRFRERSQKLNKSGIEVKDTDRPIPKCISVQQSFQASAIPSPLQSPTQFVSFGSEKQIVKLPHLNSEKRRIPHHLPKLSQGELYRRAVSYKKTEVNQESNSKSPDLKLHQEMKNFYREKKTNGSFSVKQTHRATNSSPYKRNDFNLINGKPAKLGVEDRVNLDKYLWLRNKNNSPQKGLVRRSNSNLRYAESCRRTLSTQY